MDACWIFTAINEIPKIMVRNSQNYTVVSLTTDGEILPLSISGETIGSGPDDRFDEGNSMDLSPIKLPEGGNTTDLLGGSVGSSDQWDGTDDLDDTFQYRRALKAAV